MSFWNRRLSVPITDRTSINKAVVRRNSVEAVNCQIPTAVALELFSFSKNMTSES